MQTKDKTKDELKILLKNVTFKKKKKSLSGEIKINSLSEEISEPGAKDFINPTARWLLINSCHCDCLWDLYDAPESLLGFPSIPKMSASVFRTSDRSTNGSSDVSVDGGGKKGTKKRKKNQTVTNHNWWWCWTDMRMWFGTFVWVPHVNLFLSKQERKLYVNVS